VKDRSAPGAVSEANFATEPVDDLLHDAKAKTGSPLLSRVAGVGLREFLEDERPEVDGNALTHGRAP